MQLDKNKILMDADVRFGKSRYSQDSISLSERCVDISQEWLDTYQDNYSVIYDKDTKLLREELKSYIRPRIKEYKKSTFVPTFVWWWIAQIVIKWVVDKIIEYLKENQ